ncbi:helix-turn-helix domain-containing protein [Streptomyces smyrnaeus]|uniref:helix-turn-helix domain-containing protein n=1 Tax=Streptomyces smyrnaeus TaxID=1387713 RepID=UPI0036C90A30
MPNKIGTVAAGRSETAARLLGAELRRLRDQANLKGTDVVGATSIGSLSTLSRLETASRNVRDLEARAVELGRFYVRRMRTLNISVDDDEVVGRLETMARAVSQDAWWGPYRDAVPDWLQDLLSLEREASRIDLFEESFVPGPLQTNEYAQALANSGPKRRFVSEDDRRTAERTAALRAALRQQRRVYLDGEAGVTVNAVIDEAVLMRPTGGYQVMLSQLRDLYRVCENHRTISLSILPARVRAEVLPWTTSMAILHFESGGAMAYSDHASQSGATYGKECPQLEMCQQSFAELLAKAAKRRESLEIIARYQREMEAHIERLD